MIADSPVRRARKAFEVLVTGSLVMATAVVAIACSTFGDEDDPGTPSDAAIESANGDNEASTTDGSDAPTPPKDSGAVFLDDFDVDHPACGPGWQPVSGSANHAAGMGRDGGGACLICRTSTQTTVSLVRLDKIPAKPGDSFYAEVWARDEGVPPEGGSPATVTPRFDEALPDGGIPTGFSVTLSSEWKQIQVIVVAKGNAGLDFQLRNSVSVPDDCFYVDRVEIKRTQ